MLSSNFYYRINYQIKNGAIYPVFIKFINDRLMHPFLSAKKKFFRKKHQDYLKLKKTSTDYFSINAYYWNSILNKNFKKFSYLEIGSWEGNSALYILKNHSTKKVVCVDLWDKAKKYKKLNKKNFNNFKDNLKNFKNKYSYFKMTSNRFFSKNKHMFDVIYIDGWHGTSQVFKDISNSWKILNDGGIIICDDYFYGNIYKNSDKNIPAPAINNFIKKNKKKLKIVCVNNNQIFIKKIK